jgi:quercetin dioxygenase-like cupin family protein
MKMAKETKVSRRPMKKKEPKRRTPEVYDLLTDSFPSRHFETPAKESGTLGDRIRKARELRGLALTDLSSRTGIQVDILERIEMNEITPPLGELIKLGKAVEMKIGNFISPGVEKPMTIVRADSRLAISRFGKDRSERCGYSYESLAPEKANRSMEPFLITLLPTDLKELSSHDGQEFIFVLEGEMKAQVGDQLETLRAGDAVYYDSNNPHLVKCASQTPTRVLAVLYTGSK